MVATAGASPPPIHNTSLNSRNLADAIRYCLTPTAVSAAKSLSVKMKAESCLIAAVRSFYANLPLESLQCDLLPDQLTAWLYKEGKVSFKVSKLAVAILLQKTTFSRKSLTL